MKNSNYPKSSTFSEVKTAHNDTLKLKSSNWHYWKKTVRADLEYLGLWDSVEYPSFIYMPFMKYGKLSQEAVLNLLHEHDDEFMDVEILRRGLYESAEALKKARREWFDKESKVQGYLKKVLSDY